MIDTGGPPAFSYARVEVVFYIDQTRYGLIDQFDVLR